MIINTFKFCTDEVKYIILYKTYISNFYTTQLWCNYTKAVYHKFKMAYNNTVCDLSGGPVANGSLKLRRATGFPKLVAQIATGKFRAI